MVAGRRRLDTKSFFLWYEKDPPPSDEKAIISTEELKKELGRENVLPDLLARVRDCGQRGKIIAKLNTRKQRGSSDELTRIEGQGELQEVIRFSAGDNQVVSNFAIHDVDMVGNANVRLFQCHIRRLVFRARAKQDAQDTPQASIDQCLIGELVFAPTSVRALEIRASKIGRVKCPLPGENNPFTGPVTFHKTAFMKKRLFVSDVQQYRNLRHHLSTLENQMAESFVHSKVLSLERRDDNFFNRLVSIFYQYSSNFGSSTWAPLLWLFLITLFGTSLVYFTDGAIISEDPALYVGWREALGETTGFGQLLRASILGTQPLKNPLSIFTGPGRLVAKDIWLAIWFVFQSILSPVLVFLFFLALRRRFRMK